MAVDFSATPLTGAVPLLVAFTDLSDAADSWLWDFGDGHTSADQNPTHAYSVAGTYTVTLTVTTTGSVPELSPVQEVYGEAGGIGTLTFPSTPTPGNTIIVILAKRSGNPGTVTGFTVLSGSPKSSGASNDALSIQYKVADGTETDIDGTGNKWVYAVELPGVWTPNAHDEDSGSGTSLSTGPIAADNSFVIAGGIVGGDGGTDAYLASHVVTYSSITAGYADPVNGENGEHPLTIFAHKYYEAGPASFAATSGVSNEWACIIASFTSPATAGDSEATLRRDRYITVSAPPDSTRGYIYDLDLGVVGIIDTSYESLKLTRRYWDVDSFVLTINRKRLYASDLKKGRLMLLPDEGDMVFLIESVLIDQDGSLVNDLMTVSGRSLEGIAMVERLAVPPEGEGYDEVSSVPGETAIKHYVNANAGPDAAAERQIPGLEIETDAGRGDDVSMAARYQPVIDAAYDIGVSTGLGWQVVIDMATFVLEFQVLEGVDRSDSVFFDFDFQTLESWQEIDSILDSKTVAVVAGQGELSDRDVELVWNEVSEPTGFSRREAFVDARDVELGNVGLLQKRGTAYIADTSGERSVEAKVHQFGSFQYKRDWDLGDVILVRNEERGLAYPARIIEVEKLYRESLAAPDITCVLGKQFPNEKARVAGRPGASAAAAADSGAGVTSGAALSNATPLVESGAGSAGSGGDASRHDHVHPDDGDQPLDATLTALAGLATGADKLPYSTGVDTFAQADFTAAGRALVDDASAAAQRTTLGLGSAATSPSSAFDAAGDAAAAGAAAAAASVAKAYLDAKGDLITATANDTPALLAVGTDGQVLTADSAQAKGIKWATPASSGMTNPMTTAADIIVGGVAGAPARLAKGSDGQVLTVDPTTHLLVWATPSTGSALTVEEVDGSPTDAAVTKIVFPNGTLAIAAHVATYTPAATGGASDPIADVFGTPDTAYEFAGSSLTGLTALGVAATENAHTTVPGHYYLFNNTNASPYYRGRGQASLSAPFTAVCRLVTSADANFEAAGMLVAPSTYPTSGAFRPLVWGYGTSARVVAIESWSAPGTFVSSLAVSATFIPSGYIYFGIRVASATDVSFYWSMNGYVWFAILTAHNPSFTPAIVGIVSAAQNTNGLSAAFDFLRIWNSAKTFLV